MYMEASLSNVHVNLIPCPANLALIKELACAYAPPPMLPIIIHPIHQFFLWLAYMSLTIVLSFAKVGKNPLQCLSLQMSLLPCLKP